MYSNPSFVSTAGNSVTLYSKATVTKGQWYFDKLLGFGWPGSGTATLSIRVEQASIADNAEVEIYWVDNNGVAHYLNTYDITNTGDIIHVETRASLTGVGYYISLRVGYSSTGTDSIVLGIYFSQ